MSLRDLASAPSEWDLTLDEWDPGAANVVASLAALVILRYALMLWELFHPAPLAQTITLIYIVAIGLALLGLSASGVDLREHAAIVAVIVFSVLLGSFYIFLGTGLTVPAPGPDAALFSRYSVDLLLAGENPYAASMAPAWDLYGADPLSVTPTTDGSHVTSLSYPAGSVLAFVPATVAGVEDVGKTAGLVAIATLLFLAVYSPSEFVLAPIIVLMVQDIIFGSFLGLLDALWLFPTLVAMQLWATDRRRAAAVALGIACSMKQQPWLITPFLAIWVYNEAASYRAFGRRAATLGAYGLAPFIVVNAPFVIWDAQAWLTSVLTPLSGGGASPVNQGVGLTLLTTSGTLLLPKGFYGVLLGIVTIWALVLYAVYWERVRWLAWLMPAFLLFFHFRSLYSYFQFVVPLAYFAALHQWDLARERAPVPDDVVSRAREVVARV